MLFAQTYYPPSESAGGWRRCQTEEDVRNKAGMDPAKLQLIAQEHAMLYGGPWAIVIIRNGYLVKEWFGVSPACHHVRCVVLHQVSHRDCIRNVFRR